MPTKVTNWSRILRATPVLSMEVPRAIHQGGVDYNDEDVVVSTGQDPYCGRDVHSEGYEVTLSRGLSMPVLQVRAAVGLGHLHNLYHDFGLVAGIFQACFGFTGETETTQLWSL